MKNFPGYTDLFISPVTGLINIGGKQSLTYNYIWVGNSNNVSIESPALIDLKLDIINLRKRLNNTPFIIQYPSPDFYNSQALSEVSNGLIANLNGVIVPASLTENNLWIGDSNNIPQATPIIQVGNLPNLTHNYFWTGDASNRPVETNTLPIGTLPDLPYQNIWIGDATNRPIPNQRIGLINLPPFLSALPVDPLSIPPGAPVNFGLYNVYTGGFNLSVSEPIVPTTTLKIDKSNLPNLSKGKIWMGVVNIIPPVITFTPDPPYIDITGDLNWDVRGELPIIGNNYAVPQEVGLDPGTIFMGDFENPGQITQTGLPFGRMFIGNGFGQITNTGLLPYQLFSGNPDASGRIIPITILDRTNLPILPLNNVWVGDGLDQAFPIPVGIGLNTISGLNIADTTVVPGSYTSANITVNAQGQITAAANGEGSGGTVTEITLGIGLTGIPNPITETGSISITNTGVVAGAYGYATIIVNPQGQLLTAVNNSANIENIEDNIANNATNIANNTSSINTINTTLFDPVTGIVNAVNILNIAVFAPVTGLIVQVSSNTDKIHEMIDASDTYISQIEENTSDIGILGAALGTLSDQVDENTTNISNNTSNIAINTAAIGNILNNIIPSLPVRAACRVATTENLGATYNNGLSGVGATLTNNGTQEILIIDGITLNVNQRILVKDQTSDYENGIYFVVDVGSTSTNWIIQRSPDFDGSPEGAIAEGTSLWISSGTVNEESFWMETGDGPFTVGTTPIIFSGYPGQSSINKVGTLMEGTWNADTVTVPFGGTGKTSFTPYSVVCAGTTSTGDFQNVADTGSSGEVLTSQGPGAVPVWSPSQGSIIVNQNNSTVTMVAGRQYFINNGGSLVTLTLPLDAVQGDTFIVVGGSVGGWKIVPSGGQLIYFNSKTTSLFTGYLQSTNQYNCVTIKCILSVGAFNFVVSNSSGVITII